MIIRNGNYTRLDGHDCALYEARQEAPGIMKVLRKSLHSRNDQ